MIHSMTGFARAETRHAGGQLRWELRSVNHRYLDMQFRLPEGMRGLEQDCRAIVAAEVRRGKLDATLSIDIERGGSPETRLNQGLARQIVGYVEAISAHIDRPAALDPLGILRWPGVVEEPEPDLDAIAPIAAETLRAAVAELRANRAREGEGIRRLLDGRCDEITRLVAAVESRLPAVLQAIRTKLGDRIASLGVEPDADRLEQELVMLAQKLDVSEELERLKAHVVEVRAALTQTEPVGRRLDFLMQELNREANTLASKSADAETTRHAVDLKVVIEQMREQVQNVE